MRTGLLPGLERYIYEDLTEISKDLVLFLLGLDNTNGSVRGLSQLAERGNFKRKNDGHRLERNVKQKRWKVTKASPCPSHHRHRAH